MGTWNGKAPEEGYVAKEEAVVLFEEAREVIYWASSEDKVKYDKLLSEFEKFEANDPSIWLADTDFYQGAHVMDIIKRKSDGKLFGFQYWTPISKHGEPYIGENLTENLDIFPEFDLADDFNDWDNLDHGYVYFPVEEFFIKGYRHVSS